MRYVIKGALYNFLCIIVFAIIYYIFRLQMNVNSDILNYVEPKFQDSLFLASTIQAGVGYSLLTPRTAFAKYLMMIQQWFMIFTNLLLVYFISL
jgi:hypothetical protein